MHNNCRNTLQNIPWKLQDLRYNITTRIAFSLVYFIRRQSLEMGIRQIERIQPLQSYIS